MLDITLATEFVPGTNVKGEVAGANWLFLLPRIDLERIACFGMPAAASLVALARMTSEVLVCGDEATLHHVDRLRQEYQLLNVRSLPGTLPLPDASVALTLIANAGALVRFGQDAGLLAELQRILKPDGLVYFERPGLIGGKHEQVAICRLADAFGAPKRFWLTPLGGEMHTAVADHDQATSAYFLRNGLTSRSLNLATLKQAVRARGQHSSAPTATAYIPARHRGLKARVKRAARSTLLLVYNGMQSAVDSAEHRLNRSVILGKLTRRHGLLLSRDIAEAADRPPRYLRAIAHAAGVNIDRHRWGLSARGEYSSRKVLVFLFDRRSDQPEYIVKMTRDSALNVRLENEFRALKWLAQRSIGDAETLPQVVFLGHHNQLAIVGETIVEGIPFERRSSGTPTCAYMRNAADWLTDLSVATAEWLATPAQAAEALGQLFDRFDRIYQLAPHHRRFMIDLLATMGRSTSAFPLVFQHGDPGTWNIWVTPTGRTAFLDWEAAEIQGMPLWDLLYFIRTYAAWASRTTISGDVTKGFGDQFLTRSPFYGLMIDAVAHYADRVGLAPELIEPLFYTCWMHRGLKEATRLTPSTLARGHYFNVLRASIDQRAVLQPLFRPIASTTRPV